MSASDLGCEYVVENQAATPDEVLRAYNFDEASREQVEFHFTNTRYTLYKDTEGNDADHLRWDSVGWDDVADWTIHNSRQQSDLFVQ